MLLVRAPQALPVIRVLGFSGLRACLLVGAPAGPWLWWPGLPLASEASPLRPHGQRGPPYASRPLARPESSRESLGAIVDKYAAIR